MFVDCGCPLPYRLLALECCLLKMLTLIIDKRLRERAEELCAVPPSQNGFQSKLRTNDNPFVLRCLVEKSLALNKPLFVGLLDLKNAFPATHRASLWVKLSLMGFGGPMLDWLKLLYDRIRYVVRLDGQYAGQFRSLLGILTGDPGSPHLWNLFMADFDLPWHPDDICLNGLPISKLEHADDILIASSSSPGFQAKLTGSQEWADDNGCETQLAKCIWMLYSNGCKPKRIPTFNMAGTEIKVVPKSAYVGIWFDTGSSMWKTQYELKAKKARTISYVILSMDRFVGSLPVWDTRTLYMARVDPYLTAGCEICLDVNKRGLKLLEKVQVMFLRRMLGLGSRSNVAVLFSETGLWPIKYRRIHLALVRLQYMIELPHNRPAWNAFQDSLTLAREHKVSWMNDLRIVLFRLPVPVLFDIEMELTVDSVTTVMTDLRNSMQTSIDNEIKNSHRVSDILRDRLEMDNETGKLSKKVLCFRHYLRVKYAPHRKALTRMVLSGHSLAVERRRWTERGKAITPREWRRCRFCYSQVEDPGHAMFVCQYNHELLMVRGIFLTELYATLPEMKNLHNDAGLLFRDLLSRREITALLAKLAYDVLRIFDAVPMLLVEPP